MSISGDQLVDQARGIETRAHFVAFMSKLIAHWAAHPEEWDNNDLRSFLTGLEGFAGDYGGYANNVGDDAEANPWRLAATLILAAKVYE
jgi:hypothetical protein